VDKLDGSKKALGRGSMGIGWVQGGTSTEELEDAEQALLKAKARV